jgi:hypothetical protein
VNSNDERTDHGRLTTEDLLHAGKTDSTETDASRDTIDDEGMPGREPTSDTELGRADTGLDDADTEVGRSDVHDSHAHDTDLHDTDVDDETAHDNADFRMPERDVDGPDSDLATPDGTVGSVGGPTGSSLDGQAVESPDGSSVDDPSLDDDTASDVPAAQNTTNGQLAQPATAASAPTLASSSRTTGAPTAGSSATDEAGAPLFAEGEVEQFRSQWKELQSAFVDSPQQAVREADELVAEIIQNLAATFADHKRTLEEQWGRDDEVQTEDLRLALRRYRSFFNQLLAV